MLHMVQIRFDPRHLADWGYREGLLDDQNYLIHAATRRVFKEHAPQPWVLRRVDEPIILGYTSASQDDLAAAIEGADPATRTLVTSVKAKRMPVISEETVLNFEVKVNPIKRKMNARGKIQEIDIAHGKDAVERAALYSEWLQGKLDGAAEIITCQITQFRLARRSRHGANQPVHQIPGWHTEATMAGLLKVADGKMFHQKLAIGIGRGKVGGLGTLLLQRVST
jgi:hypothetical protein